MKSDDTCASPDHVYVAGDVAGPELHTHTAHYQGELAAMLALGDDVTRTCRPSRGPPIPIPRPRPWASWSSRRGARASTRSSSPRTSRTSARGYVIEAQGHVTIVVDRASRALVGAFMAGPAVSETIHEAVLAVKARIPVDVLADTIHAFPTTARVLRHGLHRGGAFPPSAP